MAESYKVTCDHCRSDLTNTGNCVDYRLVLKSESLPPRSNSVTAMMIYPPVERPHHFCGLGCLDKWRDAQRAEDEKRRKWHEENDVEIAPGTRRVVPYPGDLVTAAN